MATRRAGANGKFTFSFKGMITMPAPIGQLFARQRASRRRATGDPCGSGRGPLSPVRRPRSISLPHSPHVGAVAGQLNRVSTGFSLRSGFVSAVQKDWRPIGGNELRGTAEKGESDTEKTIRKQANRVRRESRTGWLARKVVFPAAHHGDRRIADPVAAGPLRPTTTGTCDESAPRLHSP